MPLCSIVSWLSQCWLLLLSGSGLTGNTPVCHFASVSFVSIGHWRDLDTFYWLLGIQQPSLQGYIFLSTLHQAIEQFVDRGYKKTCDDFYNHSLTLRRQNARNWKELSIEAVKGLLGELKKISLCVTPTQTLRLSPDNITMTLHRTLHNLQPFLPQIVWTWVRGYFSWCRVPNSNYPTWSLFSTFHTLEAKLLLLTLKTQTQARADTITQHLSHFLLGQLHDVLKNICFLLLDILLHKHNSSSSRLWLLCEVVGNNSIVSPDKEQIYIQRIDLIFY